MKRILFLIICIVELIYSREIKTMRNFQSYLYNSNSITIPYRLFAPKNTKIKMPLVVVLHGAGERGTDNKKQIEFHGLATVWADSLNQKEYPCYVVAPQCPEGKKWVNTDWSLGNYSFNSIPISDELNAVICIIDSLVKNNSIDKNRIYITGLSMGGFGSWYLLMNNPERFAAAIIMSGGADPQMACKIKDIPIWNFHGDLDKVVPVKGSRKMIDALKNNCKTDSYLVPNPNSSKVLQSNQVENDILSANLLYTEYAGKGHAIWEESYNNLLVRKWMFSKRKTD